MKMKSVICNIPHAGVSIPEGALKDFVVPRETLDKFADKMIDKNVDKLFHFVPYENKIISYISRVVVDMERYRDDEKEEMSKVGMGLFYTHDDQGNKIRNKGGTYPLCLDCYDEYHKRLGQLVTNCLNEHGKCYILDCHSFHDGQTHMGYDPSVYPDVCIGFNEREPYPEVRLIEEIFKDNFYSVAYNMPFAGSLVPLEYMDNPNVRTVMLELNRRIYADSYEDFRRVQQICERVYGILKHAKFG